MEPIWMIAAIALGALAYWMDTRAIKIKARHRIDCTANGHSLIILPDGRRMGIGVTSIETSSVVDEVDRIVVEGFLQTPDGQCHIGGWAQEQAYHLNAVTGEWYDQRGVEKRGWRGKHRTVEIDGEFFTAQGR